jgi:hypothetical protein
MADVRHGWLRGHLRGAATAIASQSRKLKLLGKATARGAIGNGGN